MKEWDVHQLTARFDPRINRKGQRSPTLSPRRDFNREVSYNELKKAYELSALIVKEHGESFLPIFERLHREIEIYGQKKKLVDKALKVAQSLEGFELS